MHKAATLPSTSREWRTSAAASQAMCAVVAEHQRSCESQVHTVTAKPALQHAASAREQSLSRRTRSSELELRCRAVLENDRVCFGWLCIESSARKRGFIWRFCILDGAHLSYFRDNSRDAACLGHHVLVAVERLHCINRGLVLTDDAQRQIWAHADHETASFETWIRALRAGIAYERMRHDGSIFERPRSSLLLTRCSDESTCFQKQRSSCDDLDTSFTNWLRVRRRVKWLFPPIAWTASASRMYCVLSGCHFAAFSINLEGKWADVHGRITLVHPHATGFWLEVILERGNRVRIAGKTPEITARWLQRMRRVLKREMTQSEQ